MKLQFVVIWAQKHNFQSFFKYTRRFSSDRISCNMLCIIRIMFSTFFVFFFRPNPNSLENAVLWKKWKECGVCIFIYQKLHAATLKGDPLIDAARTMCHLASHGLWMRCNLLHLVKHLAAPSTTVVIIAPRRRREDPAGPKRYFTAEYKSQICQSRRVPTLRWNDNRRYK